MDMDGYIIDPKPHKFLGQTLRCAICGRPLAAPIHNKPLDTCVRRA